MFFTNITAFFMWLGIFFINAANALLYPESTLDWGNVLILNLIVVVYAGVRAFEKKEER